MPALIAFLADLLKLPAAVVGATVVVLGAILIIMLLVVSIKCMFRYLERRSDNGLIAKVIEKSTSCPDAVVIQAIRGTAIAAAAAATASGAEPLDADVDGVVRRVASWLRELRLPSGLPKSNHSS